MVNQNLKAWNYRAYDMSVGPSATKSLLFTPPAYPVQVTNPSLQSGPTITSLQIFAPSTSNPWWFNPLLNAVDGDQNPPTYADMYIVNNSKKYAFTLVFTAISTTLSGPMLPPITINIPVSPNQIVSIPNNVVALTSIQPGNTLNPQQNALMPLPGPTQPINIDFVVIV